MAYVTMKQMLEAGLHFGHLTRRWNPKMRPYIYGPRNGIYIINLDKTMRLFNTAYEYIVSEVARGGSILFVGTKRQAQEIIKEEAERCGMYFINHRWLGGTLTNFQTIKKSIDRLKSIEAMQEDGSINRFPKKEILLMGKEQIKLNRNIGGIKLMKGLPAAVFVVDPRREQIAVNEAVKLGIPVVGLVDTNCDPDGIAYLIPGNDDAIRAIKLIVSKMADAVLAGQARVAEDGGAGSEMEAAMASQEAAEGEAAAGENGAGSDAPAAA
ncbi:MAG: 30S ribosomal protein S2 [Desulfobacterales bacterium]|nr:30S ribosomal protein S2 [Desulfobacterales bacterium]